MSAPSWLDWAEDEAQGGSRSSDDPFADKTGSDIFRRGNSAARVKLDDGGGSSGADGGGGGGPLGRVTPPTPVKHATRTSLAGGLPAGPTPNSAFSATPPPQKKPSDMPDFLRAVSPGQGANGDRGGGGRDEDLSGASSPAARAPPLSQQQQEQQQKPQPQQHRSGEVVEVDVNFGASGGRGASASVGSSTNAPVHFLKRMQEAEQAKRARSHRREARRRLDGTEEGETSMPSDSPRRRHQRRKDRVKVKQSPRQRRQHGTSSEDGHARYESSSEEGASSGSARGGGGAATLADVIASGGIEDTSANVDLSVVPPLSDELRAKYEDVIALFGGDVAAKLLSQRWQHRTEAMHEVSARVMELLDEKFKQTWLTVCDVLELTVTDSVLHVYTAGCELLAACLTHCTFLDEIAVVALQPVAAVLGSRLRDSNTRVRDAAVRSFLLLSEHSCVGPIFVLDVVCSSEGTGISDSSRSWMALLSKMDTATALMKRDETLVHSCKEMLMKLCVQALNSSNAKVRKRAMGFALDIYRVIGKEIEPFLIAVSAATVRQLKQELEIETCDVDALHDDARAEDTDIAAFDAEDPSPLGEEQHVLAEIWCEALQLRSCKCLFSSRWKLREQLIERLHRRVAEAIEARTHTISSGASTAAATGPGRLVSPMNLRNDAVLQALAQMEEKALNDSVPAVVAVTIPLVKTTIPVVPAMHIIEFLTPLVTALVRRHTQNPQTAMSATECIILAAKHTKFGAGVACDIVLDEECFINGDVAKTSVKVVTSRLDLLSHIVETFGFEEPGMSVDRVMKYAVGAFDHPQVKARSSAANLIVEVYKQAGNVVQTYLSNLKGALLQELKEKIGAIARKDRTRTAPIQRLANIVQPLGVVPHPLAGLGASSTARPNTIGGTAEVGGSTAATSAAGADAARESGASVRQRILQWNELKQRQQESVGDGGDGGGVRCTSLMAKSGGGPGVSAEGGISGSDRPPQAPSKKRREKVLKLARGITSGDTDDDDDNDAEESDSDSSRGSDPGRRLPHHVPPASGLARPAAPNKKSRLVFS